MKKFDYQKELQRIIADKQLVEINLSEAPTFKVAYILNANENYITYAEISSSATFSGVTICRTEDIDYISVNTIYLSELSKQITDNSLYQQAQQNVKSIEVFTPSGFISALEGTKTIVELTTENEVTIAGRITGHDKNTLVLDEYSSESDRCIARSYFNVRIIVRISLDVPWIRTISRSLEDKNL